MNINQTRKLIAGGVLLISGIFFLLAGTFFAKFLDSYYENASSAEATIVNIDKERKHRTSSSISGLKYEYDYSVYVNFTVDDTEYTNIKLANYSSDMHVGDKVIVYYNLDDLANIRTKNSNGLLTIVKIIGFSIFGIGSIFLISGLFSKLKASKTSIS